MCRTEKYERALHSYGKSYIDYVRGFHRDFSNPPDVVAYPESEQDVVDLLDWARGAGVAVIPFGAGSSVVGGIEPAVGDGYSGALTMDLRRMSEVLEIDRTSRAARIQAGAMGPVLEAQLKPAGYTLRHFPQSFRVFHPGWLDRDPFGRSLRHPVHPYRRIRRKPSSGDSRRRRRNPPSARIRRGTEPGSPVHRLRGRAGRHHGGLDAGPGSSHPSRIGRRPVRGLLRGRRGRALDRPGRPVSGQLSPDRRRGSGAGKCRRWQPEPARHWVRIGGPSGGRLDGPGTRMRGRPRRHAGRADGCRSDEWRRRLAQRLYQRAPITLGADRTRDHARYLRDRHTVGQVWRLPCDGDGADEEGDP